MIAPARQIVVTGVFDDFLSIHLRFLEEAARLGEVTVLLWPDEAVQKLSLIHICAAAVRRDTNTPRPTAICFCRFCAGNAPTRPMQNLKANRPAAVNGYFSPSFERRPRHHAGNAARI